MKFKVLSNASPLYMDDVFKLAGQHDTITRISLLKSTRPLRKTVYRQNNPLYIAPTVWNDLPDSVKTSDNSTRAVTELKSIFFHRLNNEENSMYSYF